MSGAERRVVVAGAGCAGLAMASALDRILPVDWEVVVADATFEPPHTKTWCFWGDLPATCDVVPSFRWERARVRAPGLDRVDPLLANGYARVDEDAYRAHHLGRLRTSPRVRWLPGHIAAIYNTAHDRAVVHVEGHSVACRWVFQSVLRPEPVRPARTSLLQHFGGWEVETDEPIFDPSTFTLMDFDVDQHGAVAFRYVLPTAPDRALVEHTVFSPERWSKRAYDGELHAFMNARCRGYSIRRREYGAIGMRDEILPQRSGSCIYNLGSVGGLTKPTTGYTFLRIQQQVAALVDGLVHDGRPRTLRTSARRYGWYDGLLLDILARSPELGRPIFSRLFAGRSIDAVLTFLDERSSPLDEAKIFAKLPWTPFLAAAAGLERGGIRALPSPGAT